MKKFESLVISFSNESAYQEIVAAWEAWLERGAMEDRSTDPKPNTNFNAEPKNYSSYPTVSLLSRVMFAYRQLNKQSEILNTFQHIHQYNIEPTTSMINAAFDVAFNLKQVDTAADIYKLYDIYKREPTSGSSFKMLCLFVQEKVAEKAEALFQERRRRGHWTVRDCNSMINMYEKLGEMSEADRVFQEMKKDKIKPNSITYSLMISIYDRLKENIKLSQVIEEISASGEKLDVITFNMLIKSHGNQGMRSSQQILTLYR